jgi:inner membrane protein
VTGLRTAVPGRLRRALLPLAGAGGIAALDVLYRSRSWSTPVTAFLDEPAHLVTAALLWAALVPRRTLPGALPWVLVGAVAIDLDHLPLYLGLPDFLVDGGRPPTHSLATVAVLAGLSLLTHRRRVVGALAVGVLLHFVRDLATGPGISLAWPLVDASVRLPYGLYAAVVGAAALIAAVRGAELIGSSAVDAP